VDLVKSRRLQWTGHVSKMENGHLKDREVNSKIILIWIGEVTCSNLVRNTIIFEISGILLSPQS
jgi:hypothetical protein